MLSSGHFSKLSTKGSDIVRPLEEAKLNHDPAGFNLLLERPKKIEAKAAHQPARLHMRGASWGDLSAVFMILLQKLCAWPGQAWLSG